METNLKARVAAGTAIFRGERILLLHRSLHASNPGIWDLPGGQVRVGESLPRAAKRETMEETGLPVRVGLAFHVEVFSSVSKRGKMRPTVGVYFHCDAPPRKPLRLDSDEHTEFAWVSRVDLEQYPTVPALARTIRAAFRSRGLNPPPAEPRSSVRFPATDQFTFPVPA
jgi:8-oxo-dGTP pyrophosphatase MutT (NUDIX family)